MRIRFSGLQRSAKKRTGTRKYWPGEPAELYHQTGIKKEPNPADSALHKDV
jgi:hypothetical protein